MPTDDPRFTQKVEKDAEVAKNWLTGALQWLWARLLALLGFLRDPAGKYSHKRLLALALGVVMIFLLFKGELWGAGISGVIVVALSVISAVTGT